MRRCAEPMTRLSRLKVKVTRQGSVIYPSVRVHSISPESFRRFSLNVTQMFLSAMWCAEPMTQLRRPKVILQGHGNLRRGSGCPSDCCLVVVYCCCIFFGVFFFPFCVCSFCFVLFLCVKIFYQIQTSNYHDVCKQC